MISDDAQLSHGMAQPSTTCSVLHWFSFVCASSFPSDAYVLLLIKSFVLCCGFFVSSDASIYRHPVPATRGAAADFLHCAPARAAAFFFTTAGARNAAPPG